MEPEQSLKSFAVIKRLLKYYVKPYKHKIFIAVIFMVVAAICNALVIGLVKPAVDEILIKHNQHLLYTLPALMLFVHCVKGVAEFFQGYFIKCVGQQILTDLQMQMYAHLLKADLNFIQKYSAGRLISRFTNDISMMRGAVSNMLVGFAKHFLSVVFLIIIMFTLDPILSTFIFIVFPIVIFPVQIIGRRMRGIFGNTQIELGNYTERLDETFRSIKIIKSFQSEEREAARARAINKNILNLYIRSSKYDALTSPIMEIMSGFAIAGILLYGGLNNASTTGELAAFIAAFVSAYRPFKSLISLNVNLQEGIAAANRVFNILDMKPQISDQSNAKDANFSKANIEFKNVSLTFGSKQAISNLSLKLNEGNIYALVGKSGGGKTSITNLLLRFYDQSSGNIYIDNHDIQQVTLHSLRRQISLVTQDSIVFDVSIAQNIAYGMPNATPEDIKKAAKLAAADEFIQQLPQGYDTVVGSSGYSLSGGQRQRLTIARAFLKPSPIIIFDEATSNLDLQSERQVLASIKNLGKEHLVIIITHRLSSIENIKNIIVINNGNVAEKGTHKQLMTQKGQYFQLYKQELEQKELQD